MSISPSLFPLEVQASLPALLVEQRRFSIVIKAKNPGDLILKGVRVTLRSSGFAGGKVTWVSPGQIQPQATVVSGSISVYAAARQGQFPITCDVELMDPQGKHLRGLGTGDGTVGSSVNLLKGPSPTVSEEEAVAGLAKAMGVSSPQGPGALDKLLRQVKLKALPPFLLKSEDTTQASKQPEVIKEVTVSPPIPVILAPSPHINVPRRILLTPSRNKSKSSKKKYVAFAGLGAIGLVFFWPKGGGNQAESLASKPPEQAIADPGLATPVPAPVVHVPAAPLAPPPAPVFASKPPASQPSAAVIDFLPILVGSGSSARTVHFGKFEVTVGQYRKYLAETKQTWTPGTEVSEDFPAMNLTKAEAMAYCQWLSTADGLGHNYRLPTDAEWSWAVGIGELEAGLNQGRDATPAMKDGKLAGYPWGQQSVLPSSVLSLPGLLKSPKKMVPVGSTWAHPSGICGLEGNVREWVSTDYDDDSALSVARGGSWGDAEFSKATSSSRATSPNKHVTIGFRLCYE